MGKILFTDAALEEAAAAVRKSMLDAVPPEEDCPHEFPPEFEEGIRQLRQQAPAKKRPRRVLWNVVACFLAVVVALGVWLSVSSTARAKMIRHYREIEKDGRVVYRFIGNDHAEVLPDFEADWIPEGYVRRDVFHNEDHYVVLYENPDCKSGFSLSIDFLNEGMVFVIDGVSSMKEVDINGFKADFYYGTEDSPSNLVTWIREDYGIQIDISGLLDEDDLLRFARGLHFCTPAEQPED